MTGAWNRSFVVVVAVALVAAGGPIPAQAALPTLAVGATTSAADTVGSGNTCAGFLDERTHLGNLGIRRVFASAGQLPPADALSCHTNYGAVLWYSFKTSCTPAGVAAGWCDSEIQNIALAMPADGYLTYNHEPENDMTGVQFVAAFKRVYLVAKAANPGLTVVPIYMSYQWRP